MPFKRYKINTAFMSNNNKFIKLKQVWEAT